jgi:hypothetical protein
MKALEWAGMGGGVDGVAGGADVVAGMKGGLALVCALFLSEMWE